MKIVIFCQKILARPDPKLKSNDPRPEYYSTLWPGPTRDPIVSGPTRPVTRKFPTRPAPIPYREIAY